MTSEGSRSSLRRRLRFRLDADRKSRNPTARIVRQLTRFEFPHIHRKRNDLMSSSIKKAQGRPSVAFADYEIRDKRSSIMSSLLLLFAIVEGVASFVLPIIDAFGPPKYIEHQFYFEVFQIIQFLTSTLALAYLQALMYYYKQKLFKRERFRQHLKRLSDSAKAAHHHVEDAPDREEEGGEERPGDREDEYGDCTDTTRDQQLQMQPSSSRPLKRAASEPNEAQLITYTPSTGTPDQVFFVSTASSSPDSAKASDSNLNPYVVVQTVPKDATANSNNSSASGPRYGISHNETDVIEASGSSEETTPLPKHDSAPKMPAPISRKMTHIGRMFGDTDDALFERDPPFTRDPEGINLYLRLGTVVFGIGVMIMDGFRVADQFRLVNNEINCHSVLWIPLNVLHGVYIFQQTYFIFKYHRVIFNVQKFFIRFILSHMAVTNLGQWLSTVVQEVVSTEEESEHAVNTVDLNSAAQSFILSENHLKLNHTASSAHCHSQAAAFVHYLIPCGVEYSLIAGAIFYKIFQRVGHIRRNEHCPTPFVAPLANRNTPSSGYLSNDDPTECHRAHKGLFLGILLFLATLVGLAIFYIIQRKHNYNKALTIYQINYVVLFAIGIFVVSLALLQIKVLHLRQLSEEDAFDDNLLLVGLLAVLSYNIFLVVPAMGARDEYQLAGALFVVKGILEIVQALLQVFLILEASRREAGTIEHTVKKPGRSMITFLLVLNLAMWIVNTFGLKHAENHELFRVYYPGLAWKIITHLSLPLIIFFRFHSTVCLADIWTNAYKMHSHTPV